MAVLLPHWLLGPREQQRLLPAAAAAARSPVLGQQQGQQAAGPAPLQHRLQRPAGAPALPPHPLAAAEAARVFDEIKPDGIFCFNDVRATFIYEAARERGVRIGTDVSVISIDNQPLITDVLKPALTTLELPHYEMGFEAVHQLVAMIDDEAATESLARSEDSIRRSENGPMTPLRCRIIERDSIVS